jgi:RecJ-like exonuclease
MFTEEVSAPTTVALRTRRDFTLATQALKHRAEGLEKLAKKNSEEGYDREARTQLADVAAIRDFILPRFQDQQEMPLVTEEELKAGISNGIRDLISHALVVRAPEDKQEDMLRTREDHLVERLTNRIANFATEIAERAFAAGYASREDDPEVLAHKALGALGG